MSDDLYRGGSGEPLVLLHGITSSWHGWLPVIPVLEARHDVLALSLPGHLGWPWPPGTDHSVAAMADLLVERLDQLGVERPHLVGNSLGGWLSLELAARGLARSVTAFSPAGGWTSPIALDAVFVPTQVRVAELRPAAEEILADPARRQRLLSLYMEHGDRMPLDEAVRAWDAVLAVETLAAMTVGLGTPVLTPVPDGQPVSIVWCALDRLLPEDLGAPGWRAAAPDAKWSRLEAGHTPMYDDPAGVVAAIEETISRVG